MNATPLRLASYNLQKCVGLDLRRRPERSLDVIAALGAQIVVLQEADRRLPPRPAALPADLAKAAGWQVVPMGGGPRAVSLGWHGNAMLLDPAISLLGSQRIDLPGMEPRGAILAEMHTALGPLRVIGAHLGLTRSARRAQFRALARVLAQRRQMPTVLAGDFNHWGNGPDLHGLVAPLRLVTPGRSFPSPRPLAALDRFAVSCDLDTLACGVHRLTPAPMASDHLPVWLDLVRAA